MVTFFYPSDQKLRAYTSLQVLHFPLVDVAYRRIENRIAQRVTWHFV